ncbi:hypothetical protein LEP1GSC058_3875 [Leptospira fainei serovar Hurstbridge str. BUT 6]|uniref:Uncharacterized protein n=1 Tax=Leptospira fainei serovar Hurstbridge str. BUT 6 TaxID=1193011 RepID=S3V8W5_9LEPT|nr:hypothetical protein LEP1GSC058_3875 [Leptospira fainei serovar Hurstbridge str. BUT 6]
MSAGRYKMKFSQNNRSIKKEKRFHNLSGNGSNSKLLRGIQ